MSDSDKEYWKTLAQKALRKYQKEMEKFEQVVFFTFNILIPFYASNNWKFLNINKCWFYLVVFGEWFWTVLCQYYAWIGRSKGLGELSFMKDDVWIVGWNRL